MSEAGPEERLRKRRDDVVRRLAHVSSEIDGLRTDRGAESADDEHDPEGVTLSAEWSRLEGLREAAERELLEIDAALARSLNKAAAQIILPTFAQSESFGSDRQIDALPIATLRQHASLASVSVIPDSDGVVRNMPLGTITADVPRPSLSAQAAGVAGKAGEHFPVDFAINPASIPRYSFIDIADGRFDTSAVRGKDIAMIFQEPMTSLNPVFTIGMQVQEALRFHENIGKKEGERRAIEVLEQVGIPDAAKRLKHLRF